MAEVAERLSKLEKYVEQQKSWKERYEEEKRKRQELEKQLVDIRTQVREELKKQFPDIRTQVYNEVREEVEKRIEEERQKAFREAMEKVEEIKKQWNVEELQKTIMALKDDKARLEKLKESWEKDHKELLSQLATAQETIRSLKSDQQDFEGLKSALAKILPAPRVEIPAGPPAPSEISVTTEQPAISVRVERKPLSLTDKDLNGKIAVVYSEGVLGEGWFSVSDVVKAFHRHAWKRDPRISTALDEFTQWGYLEKKYAGRKPIYRLRLKPEEAKAKGLLKVKEK